MRERRGWKSARQLREGGKKKGRQEKAGHTTSQPTHPEGAMQRASACRRQQQPPPLPAFYKNDSSGSSSRTSHPTPRKLQSGSGTPWGLLLFLLAFWVSSCKGAPVAPYVLQGEQDLQLSNESSNALEKLCYMILELLHKAQGLDEKDNTKRFLFHYSKTHDTGNSDILSSVLHPLQQLVPQLHERRLKRYKVDEELRIPGGIQSRGYFIFRPRNGRRSATFR
ncbi:neuromedin-U isoform X2 [Rhineura floridana]|uniref:neuromedin-U isoform X2 n=1 Tax=Rhineura floridana TaxID=261503 RepID=UPI002AC87C4B|nr:neuromedin-U isoform X2 [Rhineura floridana]